MFLLQPVSYAHTILVLLNNAYEEAADISIDCGSAAHLERHKERAAAPEGTHNCLFSACAVCFFLSAQSVLLPSSSSSSSPLHKNFPTYSVYELDKWLWIGCVLCLPEAGIFAPVG